MKFEVYDDFISPTYQNIIEGLLSDHNTRWSYQSHMDYGEYGAPQFLIGILDNGNVGDQMLHFALLGLVSKIIDEQLPDRINTRIRAILQTPLVDAPKHYIPHTDDRGSEFWSCIYYVNDATGDTYLFDQKTDEVNNPMNLNWNPSDSLSPKKGRLIKFPSQNFHAGSSPKSDRRMLLNFNFAKR